MKLTKLYIVAAFVAGLFFSCKKDSETPGSPSFDYFPVISGNYKIYDVDSVYHADNDNNTDDSIYSWHFQVKEQIGETYIDGQGRPTQIILRYERDNDSSEWYEINRWTQVLTSAAAYKTEDNVPYHKLGFPIDNQNTWNGNDANTLEEEMYSYENLHTSMTISGLNFDSTLTVLQRNDDNFVEKIYGEEIYANHVGMIYKERDNLNKVNGLIVRGTEFRMKLVSYGIE